MSHFTHRQATILAAVVLGLAGVGGIGAALAADQGQGQTTTSSDAAQGQGQTTTSSEAAQGQGQQGQGQGQGQGESAAASDEVAPATSAESVEAPAHFGG